MTFNRGRPAPGRVLATVAGVAFAVVLAGCTQPGAAPSTTAETSPTAGTCKPSHEGPGPRVDLTVQPSRGTSFLDRSQISTMIERARAADAQVVSVPVNWRFVQPVPERAPAFGDLRATIEMVHSAGLELRLSVTGVPAWALDSAQHGEFQPPRSAAELRRWQTFIRKLFHFAGPVRYLEVWPDPNANATWEPAADAAEYARLLEATAGVVHRHSPGTRIIAGGIRGNDTDYLQDLYDALGTRRPFDHVGLRLSHNIRAIPPDDTSKQHRFIGFAGLRSMSQVVRRNGHDASLYVTEFGYRLDSSAGMTDERRAASLTTAFGVATCEHVAALGWHSLHPTPWDRRPWAIVDLDGRTTATYDALVRWSRERASILASPPPEPAATG